VRARGCDACDDWAGSSWFAITPATLMGVFAFSLASAKAQSGDVQTKSDLRESCKAVIQREFPDTPSFALCK
jgi:hypothetical protein